MSEAVHDWKTHQVGRLPLMARSEAGDLGVGIRVFGEWETQMRFWSGPCRAPSSAFITQKLEESPIFEVVEFPL